MPVLAPITRLVSRHWRVLALSVLILVVWPDILNIFWSPLEFREHSETPVDYDQDPELAPVESEALLFPWNKLESRNLTKWVRPDEETTLLLPLSPCPPNLFLLVVVCSKPGNRDNRDAIRDTWGKVSGDDVQVVFLMGLPRTSLEAEQVESESALDKDIILEDFEDTHLHQTVKSAMLLKWVTTQCDGAQYVLKTEDSVFVNIDGLTRMLRGVKSPTDLLLGRRMADVAVVEDPTHERYCPPHMYHYEKYPEHLDGSAYLMSRDVVARLYEESLLIPLFHLEDVFLTGIVAGLAGVHLTHSVAFLFREPSTDPCQFRGKHLVTAGQRYSAQDMRAVWRTINDERIRCD